MGKIPLVGNFFVRLHFRQHREGIDSLAPQQLSLPEELREPSRPVPNFRMAGGNGSRKTRESGR